MSKIYVKARVGRAVSNNGERISNLSTGAYRVVDHGRSNNNVLWAKETPNRDTILQTFMAIYHLMKKLISQHKTSERILILSNIWKCVEIMTDSLRIWGEDSWPVSQYTSKQTVEFAKRRHYQCVYFNKIPADFAESSDLMSIFPKLYRALKQFRNIHFKVCTYDEVDFRQLVTYISQPYVTRTSIPNKYFSKSYHLLMTKVDAETQNEFDKLSHQKHVTRSILMKSLIDNELNGNLIKKDIYENQVTDLKKQLDSVRDTAKAKNQKCQKLSEQLKAGQADDQKLTKLTRNNKDLKDKLDKANDKAKKYDQLVKMAKNKDNTNQTDQDQNNDTVSVQTEDRFKPDPNAEKKLNRMIGLGDVKQEVKEYIGENIVKRRAEQLGQKERATSMNLVFEGNPGTGKTQVAKLLPRILYQNNVIPKPIFVKAKVSKIIKAARRFGASKKMGEYINRAKGGVLFLDEAYQLIPPNDVINDPRSDIITTLLQGAENNHGKMVIVLAGYTKPMNKLLSGDVNEGLSSRFNRIIKFPDYTSDEMFGIFKLMAEDYNLSFPKINLEFAHKKMNEFLRNLHKNHIQSGNGRTVRNIIEYICAAKDGLRLKGKNVKNMSLDQIDTVHNSDIYNGFSRATAQVKREKE